MESYSVRGQVLLELLITTLFFVSLTGFLFQHLESHQKRVRQIYKKHEVNYENQNPLAKIPKRPSRSKKASLDHRFAIDHRPGAHDVTRSE